MVEGVEVGVGSVDLVEFLHRWVGIIPATATVESIRRQKGTEFLSGSEYHSLITSKE